MDSDTRGSADAGDHLLQTCRWADIAGKATYRSLPGSRLCPFELPYLHHVLCSLLRLLNLLFVIAVISELISCVLSGNTPIVDRVIGDLPLTEAGHLFPELVLAGVPANLRLWRWTPTNFSLKVAWSF